MIGYPPGATHCDWCHTSIAWTDTSFTHDNEALCPACWPTWLSLIDDGENGPDSAAELRERGPR